MNNTVTSLILRLSINISFLLCSITSLDARSYATQTELPLVVVICSYNNAPWVEKNLDSVFMQHYSNFRVIYVDDASQDGTANLVEKYTKKYHVEDKLTLIANKERSRKTKNVYNTFHSCQDDEIIVIVDGDDWLEHPDVFAEMNQEYLYNDVWLTWGQFQLSEQLTRGWAQAVPQELIEKNDFREFTWAYGAPRTFYAWLFKQIKLEDFIGLTVNGFEGRFYPSCDDFAMMYPMLEMARDHLAFIPKSAYIVNQYNPISTSHAKPADPVVSMQTACEVKMYKRRYEPLDAPVANVAEHLANSKADVIVVASSPEKTAALIKTIRTSVANTGSILVVHHDSSSDYKRLAQLASNVHCIKLPLERTSLINAIDALPHGHLLLINDNINIVKAVDSRAGIIDLERTGALGCYYHVSPSVLEKHAIACEHIRDQLHAWKIYRDGNHVINEHGCDMALYRKNDILPLITSQPLDTFTEFAQSLPRRSTNLHALGLCYANASATSIAPQGKSFELASAQYHVADFDEAMYATERHKDIYHDILCSNKEAAFVDLVRKNYTQFFKNLPFSPVPKIPKIIHHIWLGGTMPEQYVLWRKTWQDMHPDWVFMLWTDKEVAHFSLENKEYYDETTSFGEKANLLRYELLYQFGGLYVDTDCECFRPFDLLHHCCDFYAGCEFPQRSEFGIMTGNSIMASRPGHPLVEKFINGIKNTWHEELQVARSGTRYATNIIKKTLHKAEDVVMIFPANMFYPWATHEEPWDEPVSGQETFVQPETWSLHYWHLTWKPKPAMKNRELSLESEPKVKIDKKHTTEHKKEVKSSDKKEPKKRLLKRRTQA